MGSPPKQKPRPKPPESPLELERKELAKRMAAALDKLPNINSGTRKKTTALARKLSEDGFEK